MFYLPDFATLRLIAKFRNYVFDKPSGGDGAQVVLARKIELKRKAGYWLCSRFRYTSKEGLQDFPIGVKFFALW
jgi:hypothetical protein